MGLFSWLCGDSNKSGRSDGKRCAKDGTCFQTAKDGKHTVITRSSGGKPSVGHNRGKGKK
jgi:hypothetical protein